jgi:hypothetical protein
MSEIPGQSGHALPILPRPVRAVSGLTFTDLVRRKVPRAKLQPQLKTATDRKARHAGGLSCLFFKVGGKELGSLGLRFLICLGVVSER